MTRSRKCFNVGVMKASRTQIPHLHDTRENLDYYPGPTTRPTTHMRVNAFGLELENSAMYTTESQYN